ncbi:hypothetical protein DPMN_027738 [Dreissena polymorpha]|uniref:Uncharacterized protein n=1 Tax=Dreissena polymorpha TaxID=45954 RepID=A0A9D4LU31_DREPO|nr:hypothetical protein DPMN_027738 [Dreissena polymorpha]
MLSHNDHAHEEQWRFILHWLSRWGEFVWDQIIADTVVSLSHTRGKNGNTIDLSTTRRLDIRIRIGFKLIDQASSSLQILSNTGTENENPDEDPATVFEDHDNETGATDEDE